MTPRRDGASGSGPHLPTGLRSQIVPCAAPPRASMKSTIPCPEKSVKVERSLDILNLLELSKSSGTQISFRARHL